MTEKISIHALVKRATEKNFIVYAQKYISIHALVKRATPRYDLRRVRFVISIHALVKRATLYVFPVILIMPFQSTPS